MNKQQIMSDLNTIFCQVLNKTSLELSEETSAKDVDGWNSLTNMQIISDAEKHFNIRFKLREIIKMKNVGELCDAIQSKVSI
ncbi:MAG: acyl carrier protein [Bacteroidales bacterium]|nr:acyl carrier protein [Bacteroidales bacterium]